MLPCHRPYLASLDRLDFPGTRHELHRLRRLVGDLDLVHEDVLVLQRIALLRIVLAANLNPCELKMYEEGNRGTTWKDRRRC